MCLSLFLGQTSFAFLESVDCSVLRIKIVWWASLPQHKTLVFLLACGGKELLFGELYYGPETGLILLHTEADTTDWVTQHPVTFFRPTPFSFIELGNLKLYRWPCSMVLANNV